MLSKAAAWFATESSTSKLFGFVKANQATLYGLRRQHKPR
jgi:hypothetical protein